MNARVNPNSRPDTPAAPDEESAVVPLDAETLESKPVEAKHNRTEQHADAPPSFVLEYTANVPALAVPRVPTTLDYTGQHTISWSVPLVREHLASSAGGGALAEDSVSAFKDDDPLEAALRPVFEKFDADSSGEVSMGEVRAMLYDLGVAEDQNNMWVEAMMAEDDIDGSGTIEWSEFVAAVRHMIDSGRGGGLGAIAQQSNCVGCDGRGLAEGIARSLPYGCSYRGRRRMPPALKFAVPEDRGTPGTIDVRRSNRSERECENIASAKSVNPSSLQQHHN